MPDLPSVDRRRVLAFMAIALAALLAPLLAYHAWRGDRRDADGGDPRADQFSAIEVDRFSARLEKSTDMERLAVSVRLRAHVQAPMECYVFIVARAERSTPRSWAMWPAQSPGMAISAGGHFHAAHPASGHALVLTDIWTRIDATLPRKVGQPPFDSAVIYVVGPTGDVLLARPFPL